MAERPVFLTTEEIPKFYKVDTSQAEAITKNLRPTGEKYWYGNYLFSKYGIEKEIKKSA